MGTATDSPEVKPNSGLSINSSLSAIHGITAMPSFADPVYSPVADGPLVSIITSVHIIRTPGIMLKPISTPVFPPCIRAFIVRIPMFAFVPLAVLFLSTAVSGSSWSHSASFPNILFVCQSISLVLIILPVMAPTLPIITAPPKLVPIWVLSPSINVETMSPMPKAVPKFVIG